MYFPHRVSSAELWMMPHVRSSMRVGVPTHASNAEINEAVGLRRF